MARRWLYTSITLVILANMYLLLVSIALAVQQRPATGSASIWLVSVSSLLLGGFFAPLRRLVRSTIDRRFFPRRIALRRRLTELAGDLPSEGKVPAMAESLVQRLAEIMELKSATLLLADPQTRLLIFSASTLVGERRDFDQTFLLAPNDPGVQALVAAELPLLADELIPRSAALAQRLAVFEAQMAVPLVNGERLVGLLLLGYKRSGERFPSEEVDLMGLFAHNVASALENARLFESVTLESLTGLLRREAIFELLDKELERALRYQRPLAVAMLDLDHFKLVNDRFGHLAGDALLKRIASTLAEHVRSADLLGRYGGEEFLLVMPETELTGALEVAEKLRALVAASPQPVEGDGEPVAITLTVGVASLRCVGTEGVNRRALLQCADRRLYQAKRAGRNRVEPGSLALV